MICQLCEECAVDEGQPCRKKKNTNRLPPGWTRLHPPGSSKTAAAYQHASGWLLRHCGHMTANWPFYAEHPRWPGCTIVTHNGKGWRTIAEAFEDLLAVDEARKVCTDSRCVPGIRRVTWASDDRELDRWPPTHKKRES